MNAEDIFMFVYYLIFAVVSTVLFVAFIRMGQEKFAAVFSGIIALFCWFAVVVILIY